MLPPGTLVNAIRSALAFVILLECFASFLSLATPDEMPKADKATIKITERRKSFRLHDTSSAYQRIFHLAIADFLVQSTDALHSMKISLFLAFLLTVASAFAADAMKFVSPDKSTTLVVDKSGRRDIIELQSGKRARVHRLFYEDLDSIFKPKITEAFNASLNKV